MATDSEQLIPALPALPVLPGLDPQDPLPESKWIWRRLIVFAVVIFIAWQLYMTGNRISRLGSSSPVEVIDALLNLSHWLIGAWLITIMLYMVAPSAEQVAKMLASVSAWKSGVSTLATVRQTQTPSGTTTTTTSAAGGKPTGAPAAPAAPAAPLPSADPTLPWRPV